MQRVVIKDFAALRSDIVSVASSEAGYKKKRNAKLNGYIVTVVAGSIPFCLYQPDPDK